MPLKNTPSSVMYAHLKRLGLNNRDAATALMNTQLSFDGHLLQTRIQESSQLSRRIVHTAPGELPLGLFKSFQISCPRVARALENTWAEQHCSGDVEAARAELSSTLAGECAADMQSVLREFDIDDSVYRNMVAYINHAELAGEDDRLVLHVMLFIVTGCLGNPRKASIVVVDYAEDVLEADFQTAQTVISAVAQPQALHADHLLGLVRIVDGRIKAGSKMHVLHPDGTEIGLLPTSSHAITDVDSDVSRRHARIYREDGAWHIVGLDSTNGTWITSGSTGAETTVEAPRAMREQPACESASPEAASKPVEISPTDIIRMGASTRFMVMPVLEAS